MSGDFELTQMWQPSNFALSLAILIIQKVGSLLPLTE